MEGSSNSLQWTISAFDVERLEEDQAWAVWAAVVGQAISPQGNGRDAFQSFSTLSRRSETDGMAYLTNYMLAANRRQNRHVLRRARLDSGRGTRQAITSNISLTHIHAVLPRHRRKP